MSHFQTALNALVARTSQAKWAERFDIDRTNLNKLLRSDVPCGHRTVAKILLGVPENQREQLVFAYLMDELTSITEAAADITRRPLALMGSPAVVSTAAARARKMIGKPIDLADGLPPELQKKLKRVIQLARDNPSVAQKLTMALKLAELR